MSTDNSIARKQAVAAAEARAETGSGPHVPTADSIMRLDDLISLDALDRTRAAAPRLQPELDDGEIAAVLTGEIAVIAHLKDRMRDARRDLRRGIAALRPRKRG